MIAPTTASLPTRTHRLAAMVALTVLIALATVFLLSDLVTTVQSDGFLAVFSSRGLISVDGLKWIR